MEGDNALDLILRRLERARNAGQSAEFWFSVLRLLVEQRTVLWNKPSSEL